MRILLDLDEVIADFIGGACAAYSLTRQAIEAYWPIGKWGMVPPLSRAYGDRFARAGFTVDYRTLTYEEFWSRLNREDFWESLQPLPWARDVISLVAQFTNDWHIVTSPSRCVTSYTGKVKWLKSFFGADFDRFAITPHKHIFAQPDVLLIDDRDSNVDEFVDYGGMGIVFPCYHNSAYVFRANPLKYLRVALETQIGKPQLSLHRE